MTARERWHHQLAGERRKRAERTPKAVLRARSLIALFRTQGKLEAMSADELIERILAWRPPVAGMSRVVAEREVAGAIFRGEPDTQDMVCPPRWRASFEAGRELCEHARTMLQSGVPPEEWPEIPELETRAIGPDWREIASEEAERRIEEHWLPVLEDPRLWVRS